MLPAILTTALWSCSSICAARSAKLVGGTTANLLRMLVAAILLGIWAHTFGHGLGGAALPWFIASGLVGFGLGDVAMFASLQRIGPRLTMLLTHCIAVPLAAITEWVWLDSKLGGTQIVCALVILAGVALALAPDHGTNIPRRTFWTGVVFGLGSAMGQGFGSVLSRKANFAAEAAGQSVDGGTAAYERILAGIIIAFLFFLVLRKRDEKPAPGVWPKAWGWIVANALAGPSIGVAVYQWGVATTHTGILMPIVATVPVFTQLLVWAIDGQRPSPRTLIGGIIAVGGVIALKMTSV
jgi:drug/metabolite transporter (DMT)-like permease